MTDYETTFERLQERAIRELNRTPLHNEDANYGLCNYGYNYWHHPFFEDVMFFLYDETDENPVSVQLTEDNIDDARLQIQTSWNNIYDIFHSISGEYLLRFLYDNLDLLTREEISLVLLQNWKRVKNPWNNPYIDIRSVLDIFYEADRNMLHVNELTKEEYNIVRFITKYKNPEGRSFCLNYESIHRYLEPFSDSVPNQLLTTSGITFMAATGRDNILAYFPDRDEVIVGYDMLETDLY